MEYNNIKISNIIKNYFNGEIFAEYSSAIITKNSNAAKTKCLLPLLKGEGKLSINVVEVNNKYQLADKDSWLVLDSLLSLFGTSAIFLSNVPSQDCWKNYMKNYGNFCIKPLVFQEKKANSPIHGTNINTIIMNMEQKSPFGKALRKYLSCSKRTIFVDRIFNSEVELKITEKRKKRKLSATDYIANSKSPLTKKEKNFALLVGTKEAKALSSFVNKLDKRNLIPKKYKDKDKLFFAAGLIASVAFPAGSEISFQTAITNVFKATEYGINIKNCSESIISSYDQEKCFKKLVMENGGVSPYKFRLALKVEKIISSLKTSSLETTSAQNTLISTFYNITTPKGAPSFAKETQKAKEIIKEL